MAAPQFRFVDYAPNNPGSPRGQVSQPIYLPGALTSAAKLSEQLPPGAYGGATEVGRGMFGTGNSNVLVPAASQTATIAMPPAPPVDVGVPNYVLLKQPSGVGSSSLMAVGEMASGAPVLDVVTSTPSPSPSPSADAALLAAALVQQQQQQQQQQGPTWTGYLTNPWHMFSIAFALVFALALIAFRHA